MESATVRAAKDIWLRAQDGTGLYEPTRRYNEELKASLNPDTRDLYPSSPMGLMSNEEYMRVRRSVEEIRALWEGHERIDTAQKAQTLLGAIMLNRQMALYYEAARKYTLGNDDESKSHRSRKPMACNAAHMLVSTERFRRAFPTHGMLANPLFMPKLDPADDVGTKAAEELSCALWNHCASRSPQKVLGALLFLPDHGHALKGAIEAVRNLYKLDESESRDLI